MISPVPRRRAFPCNGLAMPCIGFSMNWLLQGMPEGPFHRIERASLLRSCLPWNPPAMGIASLDGYVFQRWGQGDLNPHSLAACGF